MTATIIPFPTPVPALDDLDLEEVKGNIREVHMYLGEIVEQLREDGYQDPEINIALQLITADMTPEDPEVAHALTVIAVEMVHE